MRWVTGWGMLWCGCVNHAEFLPHALLALFAAALKHEEKKSY